MAKYDRSKSAPADTARIQLIEPRDNALTDTFVTIYGPSSDVFLDASEALRRRNLHLAKKYKGADHVPNRVQAESYREFLADVTKDIEGLEDNGQPVPFSRAEAIKLYTDSDVAAQLSREIIDRGNF